jgi:hypothetical protein
MTREKFEQELHRFCDAKPFQAFTVELSSGERLEIDYRLAIRDGVAVYLAPRGAPTIFTHDSVNQIIGAPANTNLSEMTKPE